jgi:hypothetical protein
MVVLGFLSMGASQRTTNFVVYAPTPQLAQSVGQWAEYYRKEKAILWLGKEMPTWPQPCPLHVKVTMQAPGGATTFTFHERGGVSSQRMEIEGPVDRLIASVLPHEITHTVFAYHFGCPLPRWADEGGAVLSEDDLERERHDRMVRQFLNAGQAFQLKYLLNLREYPRQGQQVGCLYAQGFSLVNYLVYRSNRQTYLNFVAAGMNHGWDYAAQKYFQHKNVEELEQAWLKHLRDTKRKPATMLASNQSSGKEPVKGVIVRLTAPPVEPGPIDTPVYRGVAPDDPSPQPSPLARGEGDKSKPSPSAGGVKNQLAVRPGYLPEYLPQKAPQQPAGNWQPAAQPYVPVSVQLGPPQFGPLPGDAPPPPAGVSPVGYPSPR